MGSLNVETVGDEREEVAHQQSLTHESHNERAQGKDIHTVGAGTDKAQHYQYAESPHQHYLLAAYAHEVVEERRESRHSHRRGKAHEGNMFRNDAQATNHLTAVGGIDSTDGHYRYEKEDQEDDSQRLRHPIVERKILIHNRTIYC